MIINSVAINGLTGDVMMESKNRSDLKKRDEPRKRGGLQKLKKINKWILPQSLQKKYRPVNSLILDSVL